LISVRTSGRGDLPVRRRKAWRNDVRTRRREQ